ncbi:lipid-A-disaccharide synthase [Ferrimonas lipolytica]|uniref:Lipid-A-disaccharide synthase n=1 Tax=Ferrimonas lipolytica TaxID=2724191 RepID=A0A6H1UHW5_9GAMM|nr:lipid-A-disaccharide synthase [Ferrimonas lipolytica]QIZ77382.1 lipid-A-disaccharide synthase [Ferrimonas lipolytica]
MSAPLTFAMVAGEISGDILGAGLIRALKLKHPNATFVGIGGELMQAEGLTSLYPLEDLAVMGLVEVLGRLPRLMQIKKGLIAQLTELNPDCYVGIDAPDFNLRIELALKQAGIPTVHYVSPSVWAWRPKRIFKIDKATDQVLALLPFEKAFYDKYHVNCCFVGHTLADEIPLENDQAAARAELGLGSGKVLALLPGSRGGEMSRIGPVLLQTAVALQAKQPQLEIVVPLANQHRREQFELMLAELESVPKLTLVSGQSRTVMVAADAIVLASGTATLEAMLCKRPMVVAYKVAPSSYYIASKLKLMLIDRFSLPNLLGQHYFDDKDLVPELIQHDCTSANLVEAVEQQLYQDQSATVAKFTELHQKIRCDASARAADAVIALIESKESKPC